MNLCPSCHRPDSFSKWSIDGLIDSAEIAPFWACKLWSIPLSEDTFWTPAWDHNRNSTCKSLQAMCIGCLHCKNRFPVGNRSRGVSCIKLETWDIGGLKHFRWETLKEVGYNHQHTQVTPSTKFLCTCSYSAGPISKLRGSTLGSGSPPTLKAMAPDWGRD